MTIFECITGTKPFGEVGESELSEVLAAVTLGDRPTLALDQLESFFSSISAPLAREGRRQRDLEPQEQGSRFSGVANGMLRLVELMWAQDPARRPSINQVVDRFDELARFEEVVES